VKRVLVAGLGNILRGDDGFGIRVIERMRAVTLPAGTELYEAGAAGIALAQKLMDGFEASILVDAAARGGPPGTIYCLTPKIAETADGIGMHELDPSRILALARAMGALPSVVLLVGCEPECTEDLCEELSPAVAAALEPAIQLVLSEINRLSD